MPGMSNVLEARSRIVGSRGRRVPYARGIPGGLLGAAGRLTIPGAGGSVVKWAEGNAANLQNAALAVTDTLRTRVFPRGATPYDRMLNTNAFHLTGRQAVFPGQRGAFGFGDTDLDSAWTQATGTPPGGAQTGGTWTGVLQTLAIGTGQSILGKVFGRGPAPVTNITQAAPSSGISGTTIALIGAAALGGAYLLFRK